MSSDDWPDWLPGDWTMQIRKVDQRKVKCFIDPEGNKFYSKPQVDRHLKKVNTSTENHDNAEGETVDLSMEPDAPLTTEVPQSKPRGRPRKSITRSSSKTTNETVLAGDGIGSSTTPATSQDKNGASEWLPEGWTVQVKSKASGSRYKIFMDPTSGKKFFSKPQVLNYLAHTNLGVNGPREEHTGILNPLPISAVESVLAGDGIGTSSTTPTTSQGKNGASDWLPEGWTVEVKAKASGSSYKMYRDPISGKKFFSKPQVLNYLAHTTTGMNGPREEHTGILNPLPISAVGPQSAAEPDEATPEVEKSNSTKKTESIRMTSEYELISSTPAEGLPPGWVKEIRMRKGSTQKKDPYYLDPLSGYIFFSKKDALRYLESGDVKQCVMRPLRREMSEADYNSANNLSGGEFASPSVPSKATEPPKVTPNGSAVESIPKESATTDTTKRRSITGDGYMSMPDSSRKEETTEWLPEGWVVEINVRDTGTKYKCFKEVATGKKFYSKPQVMNYLGNVNSSNSRKRKAHKPYRESDSGSSDEKRQKGPGRKPKGIMDSNYTEIIETYPADGLPPGWIKELRIKKYTTHERKDPFYTDPVSGYIFRSKLDALRYLETGDVNLCAIRPRMKDASGKEVVVPGPGGQKYVKAATKKLFEDEPVEENHATENTPGSVGMGTRVTPSRNAKRNATSSATTPARSSPRQLENKTLNASNASLPTEDNGGVQEKVSSGVNVEKQGEEDPLSYQLEEDDPNWTDQCLDFAVRTLTGEILGNVQGDENGGNVSGLNETPPTKVN